MCIYLESYAVHANRILNIALAIKSVIFGKNLNNFKVRRQLHNGRRLFDAQAIVLSDFTIGGANCNDASRIHARNMRAININCGAVNAYPRKTFGFCNCLDNRFGGILNMDNNATPHT